MDDVETISFDVGKGVYDFSTIKEYEELTIFSGSEDQLLSSLVRTATKDGRYNTISDEDISPEKLFPTYPWNSIRQVLIDKFVWFGRICSIGIGIYTIFSFIKTIITTMLNCFLLRKIGGGIVDLCRFTLSPTTFILKSLPPSYEDVYANIHLNSKNTQKLLLNKKVNENNVELSYPKL